MAEYASGSIYFSGLGNGTDFSSVISQLKDIELIPAKRMALWHADWERRYNAFQELRTELGNLRSSLLKLNSMDKFLTKSYESSDPNKLGATLSSSAVEGTYKIEVNQLASNSVMTLNTGMTNKNDKINNTTDSQQFTYVYKGKANTVIVPKGTTLEGFKNLINKDTNNPGVVANLIDNNGTYVLQVMGKDQGEKATLSLSDAGTTVDGLGMSMDWNTKKNTSYTMTGVDVSVDGYNTVVNPSGSEKEFKLNYNGITHKIKLPAGATLGDLRDKLQDKGVSGTINSQGKFEIYAPDPGSGSSISVTADDDDVDALDIMKKSNWTSQAHTTMSCGTLLDSPGDVLNTTGAPQDFSYTVGGTSHTVQVNPGETWSDLAAKIQAETPDVNVSFEPAGAKFNMHISTDRYATTDNISVTFGTTMTGGFGDSSQWDFQAGENAKYRINGWPATGWLESQSNVVKNAATGVDLLLKDAPEPTGDPLIDDEAKIKTTLTINTDMQKIRENIQTFVDSMNAVRTKLQELTAFDSNKSVSEWNPDNSENVTSQFQMQRGSVLTGNYGVQLLASQLKSAVAGSAAGFDYYTMDSRGGSTGDLFTSLSQIGILTVAKEGQPDSGLLEIDWDKLDSALNRDVTAVAELFSASNMGIVDSYDFSYVSSVSGTSQPGIYEVTYTVNPDGTVSNPMVGGYAASFDSETNQITAMEGPARGLALQVDNFSPGSYNGTIRIKEGKLVSMEKQVKDMLSEDGALKILEDNYTDIMKNIATKIDKEETRVSLWERRQRERFARLEASLATYEALNKQVESQIDSLKKSSGK